MKLHVYVPGSDSFEIFNIEDPFKRKNKKISGFKNTKPSFRNRVITISDQVKKLATKKLKKKIASEKKSHNKFKGLFSKKTMDQVTAKRIAPLNEKLDKEMERTVGIAFSIKKDAAYAGMSGASGITSKWKNKETPESKILDYIQEDMKGVKKRQDWGIYQCGEPTALYVAKKKDEQLKDLFFISFDEKHNYVKSCCLNCRQWVWKKANGYVYRYKKGNCLEIWFGDHFSGYEIPVE